MIHPDIPETIIRIYPDGDQMCAIIGEMPEEIAVGFGTTAGAALIALIKDISRKDEICPECWHEADEKIDDGYQIAYECCECGHHWEVAP